MARKDIHSIRFDPENWKRLEAQANAERRPSVSNYAKTVLDIVLESGFSATELERALVKKKK